MRCISSGAEFSLFFPSLSLLFLFFCVALSAQNVLHFHVIGTNSLNNKIIHVTTSKIFSTKRGWGTSVSFCVWQPIYTQLSISRVARRLHLLILRSISQLSHSLLEYKIFTLIAYLWCVWNCLHLYNFRRWIQWAQVNVYFADRRSGELAIVSVCTWNKTGQRKKACETQTRLYCT